MINSKLDILIGAFQLPGAPSRIVRVSKDKKK